VWQINEVVVENTLIMKSIDTELSYIKNRLLCFCFRLIGQWLDYFSVITIPFQPMSDEFMITITLI
jgi:hypothetical protein